MSECIVRMEMPGTCRECFDAHRCFGTGEWHADGTIWCGLAKGYIGDERTKCPVIELPEGHGRLVDVNIVEKKIKDAEELSEFCDEFEFGGRWTVDLSKIPTIVPAEAERSEV